MLGSSDEIVIFILLIIVSVQTRKILDLSCDLEVKKKC